jgi:sugar lactone lactonase YvrE
VYGVAVDATGNIYLADVVNQSIRKISNTGVVTTLAGSGFRSYAEGVGTAASFNNPLGIAVDASGNVFVADQGNNRIRKITPAGVVSTFAGSGIAGASNGTGAAASFNRPYDIAIDANGNLYVADTDNYRIRKISPVGSVTTLAGSSPGNLDGIGTAAKFESPTGLTVDAYGNVYVADNGNRLIKKISSLGVVTTLAGTGVPGFADGSGSAASFSNPFHITIDPSGNLYVTDPNNHAIRKITASGMVTTIAGNGISGFADGPGSTARFSNPCGIANDGLGNIYIGDNLNYKIRKINSDNVVSTLAGSGVLGAQNGEIGSTAFGNNSSLQIAVTIEQAPPVFTSAPQPEITITIGADCTAPIPNFKSSATATSGCGPVTLTQSPTQGVPAPLGRRPVTIIATDIYGMQTYQTSYIDIVDATAPVITPVSNNIILPLNANGTRTITLADVASIADNCNTNPVSTISPTSFNCSTTGPQIITVTASDGSLGTTLTPAAASFNNPFGLDFDASGNLYIADQRNNKIRKISASGIVSTLAGNGTEGSANGTGPSATFNDPRGIATDAAGNVYTSDIINHRIRKITPAGVVTTLAGGAQGYANATGTSAQFSSPRGLATDTQGNLYVADSYNARIRKISPEGVVTTVAGNGNYSSIDGPAANASFYDPVDVALDASGNIYVVEASGGKVRKISSSGMVTTIAGDGSVGYNVGAGNTAKFSTPQALVVDNAGNIYVADFGNNKIRKITPGNNVSTLTTSGYPSGITIGANGNLFMTDFGNSIKMISNAGVVTTIAGTNTPGSQDGSIGVLSSGNQSTLQIQITVTGQSTPVFSTTQSNVRVETDGACSATLSNYAIAASATSSCGGAITITQSPVAGSIIPLGITTVTLTATDASNDSATQNFTVTVSDTSAPVITALSANTVINIGENGTTTITVSDIATIKDCNPYEVRISPSTFNCTDIGDQTITVEATDGSFGTGPNPAAVSFSAPYSAVSDALGNVYVAANNQIRKITSSGVVTTLAGSGVEGTLDGTGTAASFYALRGLAIDAAGNLYTAEFYSRKVRKVSPGGVVTTLAGTGTHGSADGPSASATFGVIYGVAVDPQGNVFVADASNNKIRKISASGMVTTYAGTGVAGAADGPAGTATFSTPVSLAVDNSGNLFVGEQFKIRKITPGGIVSTFAGSNLRGFNPGIGTNAIMERPMGLTFDAAGNLFATQEGAGRILKITASAEVSAFAGHYGETTVNGTGIAATFRSPEGMGIDAAGNLYVADAYLNNIRKINPAAEVTTFAGSGNMGSQNGNISGISGNYSSIQIPVSITGQLTPVFTSSQPDVSFTGTGNGCSLVLENYAALASATSSCGGGSVTITQSPIAGTILPLGVNIVTLTARDASGNSATQTFTVTVIKITPPAITALSNNVIISLGPDGTRIITPSDVAMVSDCGHSPLAIVTPYTFNCGDIGTKTVTVTATDGTLETSNPGAVQFNHPVATAVDPSGNIFVADRGNFKIRKISPAGVVSTFADGNSTAQGQDGRFSVLADMASDKNGNIYLADAVGNRVRKISAAGTVSVLAGNGSSGLVDGTGTTASFVALTAITVSSEGIIYVADNNVIRKISQSGVVTTLAGSITGFADGNGTAARFWGISGLATDGDGNIYVADGANYRVRKVTPAGIVTTIAGGVNGFAEGPVLSAKFGFLHAVVVDSDNNIYVTDSDNGRIRKISPAGIVSTFSGGGPIAGADGSATSASFDLMPGMSIDINRNLFIPEINTHKIRKVDATGNVTTIAGNGIAGYQDGSTITAGTGNQTSLQIQVTITGQTTPVFTSTQSGISLFANNSCNAVLADYTINAIATSVCGNTIITQSPLPGTLLPVGQIPVTFTASNAYGSTKQTFTVTVSDNTAPVISCPANIGIPTTEIHPEQTGWPTASDNCTASPDIVITYTDNTSQECNIFRTWKATDASGNFSTCTQSIAVPPMAVSLGPDMYILYGALSYTGCRTITPVIAGGAGPYTYVWSSTHAAVNNATSATITVCSSVETTHTYTVTVTSANGCSATATLHLTFINISCSNNANNEKVTVCLRPQGNPNNCNNVCVSPNAAQVLINNGSYYGKCLPGCEIPVQSITGNLETNNKQQNAFEDDVENEGGRSFEVKVRNNPTQTSFSLTITSSAKEKIMVRVVDVLGRSVEIKQNVVAGELFNIGSRYGKGVFFAEITQAGKRKTLKLVKQ